MCVGLDDFFFAHDEIHGICNAWIDSGGYAREDRGALAHGFIALHHMQAASRD
jgi:hypothetical protein